MERTVLAFSDFVDGLLTVLRQTLAPDVIIERVEREYELIVKSRQCLAPEAHNDSSDKFSVFQAFVSLAEQPDVSDDWKKQAQDFFRRNG